jgi:hypothetical protein
MPGYDAVADDFVVFMPAPLRVHESDDLLLDADSPREGFTSCQAVIDAISRIADLGVTWTHIPRPGGLAGSLDEHLDHLAWGAEEVAPFFRSAWPASSAGWARRTTEACGRPAGER